MYASCMQFVCVYLGTCPVHLSQAHHFFKVGEKRSGGRAMLLCLAQQLAKGLAGFAKLLVPVVEQHRRGEALSLNDTYEK